jgi:hypothetical protein
MELATKADYARQHGVSRPAVNKWVEKEYLVFHGDKVDVAASDDILRDKGLGRFKEDPGAEPVNTRVNNPVNTSVNPAESAPAAELPAPWPPREPTSVGEGAASDDPETLEGEFVDFLKDVLDGQFRSFQEADKIHRNAMAGQQVLKLREQAGELVETAKAERQIFEMMRAVRDAWLNWPARVAPMVAADLGVDVDRVTEVLTHHVTDHLSDLGEPDTDSIDFSEPDDDGPEA